MNKIAFPYDATYNKLVMRFNFGRIVVGLQDSINYQLPTVKFRDHLRDCFGFLT